MPKAQSFIPTKQQSITMFSICHTRLGIIVTVIVIVAVIVTTI
jgi:hypothetical protein